MGSKSRLALSTHRNCNLVGLSLGFTFPKIRSGQFHLARQPMSFAFEWPNLTVLGFIEKDGLLKKLRIRKQIGSKSNLTL